MFLAYLVSPVSRKKKESSVHWPDELTCPYSSYYFMVLGFKKDSFFNWPKTIVLQGQEALNSGVTSLFILPHKTLPYHSVVWEAQSGFFCFLLFGFFLIRKEIDWWSLAQDSQFQSRNINAPLHGKFVWEFDGQMQPGFWNQGILQIFLWLLFRF